MTPTMARSRATCLAEGLELQNCGLKIRLEKFRLDGKSIDATILSSEGRFTKMESGSMTFRRDVLTDRWVSELSYLVEDSDRKERVVIQPNFGMPMMLYVSNNSPEFNQTVERRSGD